MKHIIYLTSILLSLFFVSCEKDAELPRRNNENTEIANEQKDDSDNIVKGIVRVKLSAEIVDKFSATKSDVITKSGNDALDAYMQEIGAKSMTRVFPYDEKFEARHREYGLHLWYDIEFDDSKPTTKVTNDIKSLPGVIFVENIHKVAIPKSEDYYEILEPQIKTKGSLYSKWDKEDPNLGRQWHYNNTGNADRGYVKGADINLFKAWNIETGDKDVIVAVLDGGVDYTHPDLKGSMWINGQGKCGKNFVNESYNIVPEAHGTHVAGTIAARNNNGEGVCGIAGGDGTPESGVRLMSCQIFSSNGNADTKRIANGFVYAADEGAIIANCSWCVTVESDFRGSLQTGIDYFIDNAGCDINTKEQKAGSRMKGGIVICASGNYYEGNQNGVIFPAAYENEMVIAVASMLPDFIKAPYANCGNWVDITAPGGAISTGGDWYALRRGVYSTVNNNSYAYDGGTSMAAPHVTGIAALVVSKFGKKGYTNKDLKERLLSAKSTKYDIYTYNPEYKGQLGVGLIDAFAALAKNENQIPSDVATVNAKPSSNSVELEWEAVTDKDDGTASKYIIYYSDQKLDNKNYTTGQQISVDASDKSAGDKITAVVKNLKSETEYFFAIIAVDRWDLKSANPALCSATTTKEVNIAPVLTVEGGNDIKVEQGKTASVTINVTDKLGWSCTVEGAPAGITHTKNTDNIKLDITKDAPVGKHAIKVTVTNTANLSASETINVEVTAQGGTTPEDQTLSIVKPIDAVSLEVNGNKSINLGDFFNDSKGNTITYTVTSDNKSVADATVNGATLNVKAVGEGSCNITVTANNGKNETLSSSFKVTVSKNGGPTPDNEVLAKLTSASPVSDVLSVKINSRVNSCNLVIAGTTGKVFVNKDLSFGSDAERNLNINVANLAAGAYVLKVSSNGETFTQHFVKL